MFTPVISSSMVTVPSALQSPAHAPGVAVGVGAAVGGGDRGGGRSDRSTALSITGWPSTEEMERVALERGTP